MVQPVADFIKCPSCGEAADQHHKVLDDAAGDGAFGVFGRITDVYTGASEPDIQVTLIYCGHCGVVLGVVPATANAITQQAVGKLTSEPKNPKS
jgi:uncharacterized Zn finger protein